jgi:signal transduction histidine kinase
MWTMDFSLNRAQTTRYLSIARLVLASACLLIQLFFAPVGTWLVTLSIGVFALLSYYALRKRHRLEGRFGAFVLFVDTLFFILLARYGSMETLWLAPLFYVYLLLSAVSLYTPREVLIVCVGCTLFFATTHPGPQFVLRETILVAGAFACAFSFQKRRLEQRLEELMEQARQSEDVAAAAREAEQQRIAADFHDGPLQSMISIQMRLEILRKLFERDRNAGLRELEQLQEMAKTQVRDMRTFVRNMRPLDVDGAGLTAAIRRLLDDFQKESGIPVTFLGGDRTFSAAPETCTDVLYMIREALHNVQKHSKATRVAVSLEKVGKLLEISVDDNGVGFHFSGTYSLDELDLLRLGPISLKRRARSLGAEMLLESRPGRGAGLKLRVPV